MFPTRDCNASNLVVMTMSMFPNLVSRTRWRTERHTRWKGFPVDDRPTQKMEGFNAHIRVKMDHTAIENIERLNACIEDGGENDNEDGSFEDGRQSERARHEMEELNARLSHPKPSNPKLKILV
ncbi:hypothetical protein LR48_Vigan02g102800 [Vigna angularis]|uniref:Uncharacterized protein n=1 Tax=Phaseolus angularis TaxID=3914 RepID=A0A0L9TWA9_PHAAN|nr:hypothetical protein LR48_Vigan02g102800 [Vigna angularis]